MVEQQQQGATAAQGSKLRQGGTWVESAGSCSGSKHSCSLNNLQRSQSHQQQPQQQQQLQQHD